jgi:hypothetical protein
VDKLNTLGACMTVFATGLAVWSYFLLSNIPLTALGIGLMILGVSFLLTPAYPMPSHAVRALLEGATLNIEALLEELNISNRGYYVKAADDRVYAFIPIGGDTGPPSGGVEVKDLIARGPKGKYLVVVPPSSEIIRVEEVSRAEFDDALKYVLVDLAELAESVETATGEHIVIKIKKPRGHLTSLRFRNVLGSLEASIAASLLARTYGAARIVDEVDRGGERVITLKAYHHG